MIKKTAIFHYRLDETSNLKKRNKWKFVASRANCNARGGVTIAFVPNEDTSISVGVSRCSIDDMFVKTIGRSKAEGRAWSTTHRIGTIRNLYSLPDLGDFGRQIAQWNGYGKLKLIDAVTGEEVEVIGM